MIWEIAILLLCINLVHADNADCTYAPNNNIHYDLNPLKKDDSDYYVFDRLSSDLNQTFVFNICRDVAKIPVYNAEGVNLCAQTVHDIVDGQRVMASDPVPAFMITRSEMVCRRLSAKYSELSNIFYSYDSSDLTAGVAIYYRGGDYYWEGVWYYSVWIYIRCSDTAEIATEADVNVGLASSYIWLDSVYACPTECHPKNGKICSGHGICMVDDSVNAPRCFCNSLNKGEDCSQSVGLSMTQIFMLVDVVAVVFVVGTIIYLGCKLRKIRLDPEANVSLDTKFNELGSIAYTL